jgi:hypothetical protein
MQYQYDANLQPEFWNCCCYKQHHIVVLLVVDMRPTLTTNNSSKQQQQQPTPPPGSSFNTIPSSFAAIGAPAGKLVPELGRSSPATLRIW